MYFRNQWNKDKPFLFFLLDCSEFLIILWKIERGFLGTSEDLKMDKFTSHDTQDSRPFIYDAYSICMQFSETSFSTLAPSPWSPRTFPIYIQGQVAFQLASNRWAFSSSSSQGCRRELCYCDLLLLTTFLMCGEI